MIFFIRKKYSGVYYSFLRRTYDVVSNTNPTDITQKNIHKDNDENQSLMLLPSIASGRIEEQKAK